MLALIVAACAGHKVGEGVTGPLVGIAVFGVGVWVMCRFVGGLLVGKENTWLEDRCMLVLVFCSLSDKVGKEEEEIEEEKIEEDGEHTKGEEKEEEGTKEEEEQEEEEDEGTKEEEKEEEEEGTKEEEKEDVLAGDIKTPSFSSSFVPSSSSSFSSSCLLYTSPSPRD